MLTRRARRLAITVGAIALIGIPAAAGDLQIATGSVDITGPAGYPMVATAPARGSAKECTIHCWPRCF